MFLFQDYDECRDNNGGCEDLCINTISGNECACRNDGFELGEDDVSCVGKYLFKPIMFLEVAEMYNFT